MSGSIRFSGSCPTCGRGLFIPTELHNHTVRCLGCGAEFIATTLPPSPPKSQSTTRRNLDSRVDALLAAADRQLEQACWTSPNR